MLPEADLLLRAETMLVEVLGRVREQDLELVLPPLHGGSPRPVTVREAVRRHVEDEVRAAAALGGSAPHGTPGVPEAAAAVCAAVERLVDGDALVETEDGRVTVRDHLLRLTVTRSLLAHYVAARLGSTACPLPEELARPLWERTAPDAEQWRRLGHFREPRALPEHVSWRDRFLLTAGHEPHPVLH